MGNLKKIYPNLKEAERRIFWFAVFFFVLSSSGLTAIFIAKATIEVPAPGGEYLEGAVGQPAYINPVLATNEIDKSLVRLVFGRLEDLASKIEPDKDGRIWKVRLKENLKWSDQRPLSSDDVLFTIQKIQDSNTNSPFFLSWQGVLATRISELELEFSLANPYSFFAENLKNLRPLPRHIFGEIPPANWRLSDYNLSPVGSGPYQFESYDKESGGFITLYRLKANPNYVPSPAFIKKFGFRFFRKAEKLVLAFSSGQVDGFMGLRTEELSGLKRPHQVIKFSLPSYYAVFLNQSRNLSLKELVARKALTLAAPKEKIIQEIFDGEAETLFNPIPRGAAYFDPEVQEDSVSTSSLSRVQFASDILDEALWRKSSSSDFRSKKVKSGEIELGLNLVVPRVPFLLKTANILKSAWEEIGFKISLVVLSPEEIVETVIKNRDYEALLFGNVLNENSDLFSFWHSSGRFSPGLNLSLYNNKKADELIEAIRQNLDPEKRKNQFSELQQIITSDYPAVFLYSPNYLYIARKDLVGPMGGSITESANRLHEVSSWYLKTVRVFK